MNGSFTSENYPAAYPHNSRCNYTITVPEGYSITLNFTDFQIEAGYDFVWVKENEVTLFNGTGSKNITSIKSWGNSLFVYFTSDGTITESGFSATYYTNEASGCGGYFTTMNGYFTSENYPSTYPHNSRCNYTIAVPEGYSITLTFTDFRIEAGYDFVWVKENGATLFSGTGSKNITSIKSWGNSLFVYFTSDGSITESGFSATYYTNNASGCGGYFTSMNGYFTSENYPSAYPHNSRCSYTIMVPEGYNITLTFTDFQIEAGYDFVWVKENVVTLFNETGSKEHITAINSSGNSLYVYFTSDGSMAKSGFSATYYTNRVVNGNWSTWSIWENCDVTCGIGIQHRRRACDNPCPVLGGFICTGNDLQTQNCSTSPCPVVVDINSQLHSSGVVAGVAVACIICTFVLCLIVHFTIRRLRQNKGRQEDRAAIIDGGVNCDEFEVSYANPGYIIPDNSQDDVCESTERPERNAEQNLYGNLKY